MRSLVYYSLLDPLRLAARVAMDGPFALSTTERLDLYLRQPRSSAPTLGAVPAPTWPAWTIRDSALGAAALLWWLRRYLLARAAPLDLPTSAGPGRFASASDA